MWTEQLEPASHLEEPGYIGRPGWQGKGSGQQGSSVRLNRDLYISCGPSAWHRGYTAELEQPDEILCKRAGGFRTSEGQELERGGQESFGECGPHIQKLHCRNTDVGGAGVVLGRKTYLCASHSIWTLATGKGVHICLTDH